MDDFGMRSRHPAPTLFDAKQTEPPRCKARDCPSIKNLCLYDADVSEGIRGPWSSRPKTCLNSAQLGPDEELPF